MNLKQEELISVIVPIYNTVDYFEKCIESVIGQTYTNLEIILVDDGSNDGSEKICDDYKNKDNRIRVIHQKNEGVLQARNTGLNFCTGEYIAFVDSDDVINENMMEILYNNIIESNADLSICRHEGFVNNYTKIDYKKNNIFVKKNVIMGITKFDNLFNDNLYNYTFVWNKLYKNNLFKDVRFKNGKFHEDVFLAHYILDKANVIVDCDAVLYYYRQRKESISHDFSYKKKIDDIDGLKDRINFFQSRYQNTKYVNLSLISYVDKIIIVYCLCCYHKKDNYKENMKEIKKMYEKSYKEVLRITSEKNKRLKYKLFKVYPYIVYKIYKKKYINKEK